MLQDVEAGRRTEIDVVNGAIVEAGRRHSVPTPLNDAMVWMVKSLQAKYLAAASSDEKGSTSGEPHLRAGVCNQDGACGIPCTVQPPSTTMVCPVT